MEDHGADRGRRQRREACRREQEREHRVRVRRRQAEERRVRLRAAPERPPFVRKAEGRAERPLVEGERRQRAEDGRDPERERSPELVAARDRVDEEHDAGEADGVLDDDAETEEEARERDAAEIRPPVPFAVQQRVGAERERRRQHVREVEVRERQQQGRTAERNRRGDAEPRLQPVRQVADEQQQHERRQNGRPEVKRPQHTVDVLRRDRPRPLSSTT